jgi:hypothetical protein
MASNINVNNILVGVNTAELASDVRGELATAATEITALQSTIAGSSASGLTAAGSTQGTALALTNNISVITTAAASTGVRLPSTVAGTLFVVVNRGANPITVYPPTGGTIDGGATNAGVALAITTAARFVATAAGTFFSA